jgi:UDPglucose 6-dehydrogenase
MVNKGLNIPLFFGLSHMGQVFSSCWSLKIGACYVFDTNVRLLRSFKNREFTSEEPNLKKLKTNNIKILKNFQQITDFKYIFFTIDAELDTKNGEAKLSYIYSNLKKILNLNFKKKVYLIISSQINPEFFNKIKNTIKINENIKIFYLVDTLQMGNSIDKFLNPYQIIIGGEKKEKDNILEIFKKFKSKKIYLKIEEAIIIKMAINIYLSFSVTFANIIDNLSRQYNSNYSNIVKVLKNDQRIGCNAYINPSLGFSGGHLERDLFFLYKITKNKNVKKIIKNIIRLNNRAIDKINDNPFFKSNKFIRTLVVGKSYKKNSFSIVNSAFKKMNKKYKITFFDDIFDIYEDPKRKLYEVIKNKDLIVYHYSSILIKNEILNFSKKNSIKVLNISKKKISVKNNKNLINIF